MSRTFNFRRIPLIALIVLVASLAVAERASAQTLQYPPYGSWRGRAVARDGLFRVQRYRWGNGITPQGATVLTTLIPVIPDIIRVATNPLGAEDPAAAAERAGWSEYAEEQKRATDVLLRLEKLAGSSLGEPAATGAAAQKPSPAQK
jgi:hypothetical protein